MGKNITVLIYYFIVIILTFISGYLSYRGFQSSFGGLAILFSISITLLLIACDLTIQKLRLLNSSILKPVVLFCIVCFFSGVSNFNYIYTTFMEGDVIRDTLDRQYSVFRDNMVKADGVLRQTEGFKFTESKQSELERVLIRLHIQVTDPGRPGCGSRCQEHLEEISDVLGRSLTKTALPSPRASMQEIEKWYNTIASLAQQDLESMFKENNYSEIVASINFIDNKMRENDSPTRGIAAHGDMLAILRHLSEVNAEVERRVNVILPQNEQITLSSIDPSTGRLGEIAFSLENAFVERPHLGVTALSTILATIVDLFPLFYALLLFSRSDLPSSNSPIARQREMKKGVL